MVIHSSRKWIFIVPVSFPFIRQWMSHNIFHDSNQKYEEYVYYMIPLTFFISLINLLSRYISNFRRVTIPAALEQLGIKIALPLIMLMFISGWINVSGVLLGSPCALLFRLLDCCIIYGIWENGNGLAKNLEG
jgi:hypothetical protein